MCFVGRLGLKKTSHTVRDGVVANTNMAHLARNGW